MCRHGVCVCVCVCVQAWSVSVCRYGVCVCVGTECVCVGTVTRNKMGDDIKYLLSLVKEN